MLPKKIFVFLSVFSVLISLTGNFFPVAYADDTTPTPGAPNDTSSSYSVYFTPSPASSTITTSTESVGVSISGLTSDKSKYKYCLESDVQNKCKDDALKEAKDYISNDGVFRMTVCGDGADKLKTGCDDKDWFHVTSTYVITLYDGNTEVTSASFLIAPVFPVVNFAAPNNGQGVSITVDDDGNVVVNGKTVDTWINEDDPDPQVSLPISASMSTPSKIRGERANNYRLELDSNQSDYSVGGCVTVKGDQNKSSSIKSDEKLDEGSYELVVQDQVDDSASANALSGAKTIAKDVGKLAFNNNILLTPLKVTKGLLSGGSATDRIKKALSEANPVSGIDTSPETCQGGFTYYTIPINVSPDPNNPHSSIATIDVTSIEADPENWYLSANQKRTLGVLPCTAGTDGPNGTGNSVTVDPNASIPEQLAQRRKIVTCTEYSTALANIGITPLSFIQSFAKILLEIGALAVLGYLIYGGWLILTSKGDKDKIQKAREMITSAIIGFIFIILSFAILGFIGVDILQLPGLSR